MQVLGVGKGLDKLELGLQHVWAEAGLEPRWRMAARRPLRAHLALALLTAPPLAAEPLAQLEGEVDAPNRGGGPFGHRGSATPV